jgi:hypothetical protein
MKVEYVDPAEREITKLRSELAAAHARIRSLEAARAIVARLLANGAERPLADRVVDQAPPGLHFDTPWRRRT